MPHPYPGVLEHFRDLFRLEQTDPLPVMLAFGSADALANVAPVGGDGPGDPHGLPRKLHRLLGYQLAADRSRIEEVDDEPTTGPDRPNHFFERGPVLRIPIEVPEA